MARRQPENFKVHSLAPTLLLKSFSKTFPGRIELLQCDRQDVTPFSNFHPPTNMLQKYYIFYSCSFRFVHLPSLPHVYFPPKLRSLQSMTIMGNEPLISQVFQGLHGNYNTHRRGNRGEGRFSDGAAATRKSHLSCASWLPFITFHSVKSRGTDLLLSEHSIIATLCANIIDVWSDAKQQLPLGG